MGNETSAMRTTQQSVIGWGFFIPEEKLHALLAAFLKRVNSEPGEMDPAGEELEQHIETVMQSKSYDEFFHFTMANTTQSYVQRLPMFLRLAEYEDKTTGRGYVVERWRAENYGDTFRPLPDLDKKRIELMSKDLQMAEMFEKLEKDLHLKEAGIEIEEQWLQCMCIM